MSLAEQMGNIGSEVSRAFRWEAKGNREQARQALYRGLELFDFTLSDRRYPVFRKQEIARAREVLNGFFFSDVAPFRPDTFQRYFDDFAREANARRGNTPEAGA